MIICEWFAACENDADGTVWHPALGNVPTCTRCADKLSLDLVPFAPEDEDDTDEVHEDGTECVRHALEDCNDPHCIRARGGSVLASELRDAERQLGTW